MFVRSTNYLANKLRSSRRASRGQTWYGRLHLKRNLLVDVCFLGEWVLVIAAAGGVGLAAVQLAKGLHFISPLPSQVATDYPLALGAKVIAAAGAQDKMEVCMKYGGADYAVNYTTPNWQKEVLEITKGKGVDVVYDPVGRIRGELIKDVLQT